MDDEPNFTFYYLDFIHFNYQDGDYMICKTLDQVFKVLEDCDGDLDTEPEISIDDFGNKTPRHKSILIKGIPMTEKEYQKYLFEILD